MDRQQAAGYSQSSPRPDPIGTATEGRIHAASRTADPKRRLAVDDEMLEKLEDRVLFVTQFGGGNGPKAIKRDARSD